MIRLPPLSDVAVKSDKSWIIASGIDGFRQHLPAVQCLALCCGGCTNVGDELGPVDCTVTHGWHAYLRKLNGTLSLVISTVR